MPGSSKQPDENLDRTNNPNNADESGDDGNEEWMKARDKDKEIEEAIEKERRRSLTSGIPEGEMRRHSVDDTRERDGENDEERSDGGRRPDAIDNAISGLTNIKNDRDAFENRPKRFFNDDNKVRKMRLGDAQKTKTRGVDGDATYVKTSMPTYAHYVKGNDEYIINRPFHITVKYNAGTDISSLLLKKNLEVRLKDTPFMFRGSVITPDRNKFGGYTINVNVSIKANIPLAEYNKSIDLFVSGIMGIDDGQKDILKTQIRSWVEREVDIVKKQDGANKGAEEENDHPDHLRGAPQNEGKNIEDLLRRLGSAPHGGESKESTSAAEREKQLLDSLTQDKSPSEMRDLFFPPRSNDGSDYDRNEISENIDHDDGASAQRHAVHKIEDVPKNQRIVPPRTPPIDDDERSKTR